MNYNQFTVFYSSESPFSQWYRSRFKVNGIEYSCTEQYMMYQKALYFGDTETAQKVLQATNPRDQKMLGRKVKNFSDERWKRVCEWIVYEGNLAKFSQNYTIKNILFATENTMLVEASPFDVIWGVGLPADDPNVHFPDKWKGKNLLGKILTQVREELKKQDKEKALFASLLEEEFA